MADITVRVPKYDYLNDSYRPDSDSDIAEIEMVEAYGEPCLKFTVNMRNDSFGIPLASIRRALRALDDGKDS